MNDNLRIDCEELRELSEEFPAEMQVVTEMLTEAEEDLCEQATQRR
jgi:hypothetical protein